MGKFGAKKEGRVILQIQHWVWEGQEDNILRIHCIGCIVLYVLSVSYVVGIANCMGECGEDLDMED